MWPNPQKNADLVTFTEEILNAKIHFLCSENVYTHFKNLAANTTIFLKCVWPFWMLWINELKG